MKPEDIDLVQASYKDILPEPERFTALLYDHLFALRPELLELFEGPRLRQELRVAMMLSTIVNGLDDFERVVPAVLALGERHKAHGIRPEDYETFGQALIGALETRLGKRFTPAHRTAWRNFYAEVSALMQSADTQERGESKSSAALI